MNFDFFIYFSSLNICKFGGFYHSIRYNIFNGVAYIMKILYILYQCYVIKKNYWLLYYYFYLTVLFKLIRRFTLKFSSKLFIII